jgi:1-aminocyclopropane-1-carboxylate deaminase/D-cysteine desulfhydrase-like pyridoxal-dependent ACC family enzyme
MGSLTATLPASLTLWLMATLLRPVSSVALDRLAACPRVPLGCWPTPLERPGPAAPPVWVKRDDLSGWGRGGAKARKLEYLLGHAQGHQYSDVVMVTGNVTNLVFDILPALDRSGIRSRILVVNYPRGQPTDREAIFSPVRDRVELLEADWAGAIARALALWTRARLAGRRPFLLLPGAAHPASVIGNAGGLIELAEQLDQQDCSDATVWVTVATGTTLAGFLLGAHAVAAAGGPRIRVVGVAVDRAPLAAFTLGLIRWTERFLGLPTLVPTGHIEIRSVDGELPFAAFTPEVEAACYRVRRDCEFELDPIFGGKTWRAMEQTLTAHRDDRRPVVYWHCGFTPEWRGLGSALRAVEMPV